MNRTTTLSRCAARIGCTLALATTFTSGIALAQIRATSVPTVAPMAAAPVATPATATAGGSVIAPTAAFAVPVSGVTAFGSMPTGSAAGIATVQNGALNGATGTNVTAIVPGATTTNNNAVSAAALAAMANGTITTANGTTINPAALVGGNVVYWPYPIYIPTPNGVGGGPPAAGDAPPSVPGAQASETQEYNEPAPEPQIDYRSIPGGRANTNLSDPAFRAAHIRRW